MKRITGFITALLIASVSLAQTSINGFVRDNKGKGINGASITIKDSYDGAVTDSTGHFTFNTGEKGDQVFVVSCIGYNGAEQKVSLNAQPLSIDFVLKEKLDELKAVIVTAGSFAAGDSKRAAVMSSLDIATTAGSNADITAALKTLPGTQEVGEQEGLFVRGGAGYETKQFIDGTLVDHPYFSSVPDLASRGRFSPFLFKGTVFTTGGYSALYGQALSSVLLLESIDLPERSEVDASISPLFVGAGTQQLAPNKKSSWGINYGYTNVGLYFNLVKQTPDYFTMPQFHSGDANFRFKTKRGGIVKFYTTFASGKLGLRRPDIDSVNYKDAFQLKNYNWYNNISWKENLGNNWKLNVAAGYSTNNDEMSQRVQDQLNQNKTFSPSVFWMNDKAFNVKKRQDLSQLKVILEKRLFGISTIRFGGEYWYAIEHTTYNYRPYNLVDHYKSLFSESDIFITNSLAAKVGLRFEQSSPLDRSNIAPRISFAYKTGAHAQMSFAYGIFYQKPENNQLYDGKSLNMTKATHYIINYQKMTTERIFRIEGYYKKYDQLIKMLPATNNMSTYNNNGDGDAKGIDLFWRDKKSFKNFDYWVSYSYIDTKRDFMNYPYSLQPNFVANHTASVVLKRFYTSIKSGFNFTYTYASGRPYYNFMVDNNSNKYFVADEGKTKNYNSLNFSGEYVPSVGKVNAKTNVVLFASVTNLLGANNVYGYNYSYNGSNKEAVLPPAKRFYFIGLFLSWGVDRSQDAINNNL